MVLNLSVSLFAHAAPSVKNLPDHGGNRTRDLWFASPKLSELQGQVGSCVIFGKPP